MNYFFSFILCFFFITPSLASIPIRVLLGSINPIQNSQVSTTYEVKSATPFLLHNYSKTKKCNPSVKTLYITLSPRGIFLSYSGKPPRKIKGSSLSISSTQGRISVGDKEYSGALSFLFYKGKPAVINTLDLEDYVYSVIRFEIFQSWPLEIQKVQAVASRTFAVYHMLKARKQGKPYDIKCSSATHQHYGGWHPYAHVREAVEQTKNLIVMHDNSVALAMFDICCGGIIPFHIKTIHEYKAPYLARKVRCLHCNNYKFHTWNKEFQHQEIMKRLANHAPLQEKIKTLGTLKEIAIREHDKAGIVHRLTLRGTKKSIECSGQHFLDSLKNDVKSLSFTIKNNSKGVTISGKGFGHQLGICQRGAYELVKKGWDFKKILHFYYPNTVFAHLNRVQIYG